MATDDELTAARDLAIDACGRIAEFWGFTRTMGRAFGLLYLSREPLPQGSFSGGWDLGGERLDDAGGAGALGRRAQDLGARATPPALRNGRAQT